MTYLLDTDICISFLQDKYRIADKIESVGIENCFISEISIIELTYGAYNSRNFEKHISEVEKIRLLYDVVPISEAVGIFAKEKVRLRQQGRLIPDFDLLIGASAIARSMILVTSNDKHLARIKSIRLENWRDQVHNEFLSNA